MSAEQTSFLVAVVRLDVLGLASFHAKCLNCGWASRGTEDEEIAKRRALGHGAKHADDERAAP